LLPIESGSIFINDIPLSHGLSPRRVNRCRCYFKVVV
jgi:hypothetical protein